MRDDICTIPVSEGFEEKDGCPLCRMRAIAEKRVIDYIMGAAMMEPDVRVNTNELGFCRDHFGQMMKAGNRLSLALILDSHLQEIDKQMFDDSKLFKPSEKKRLYRAVRLEETCFVCSKLNFGMSHMVDMIYRMYQKEEDCRALYAEQTELCLPHYTLLMQYIPDYMDKDTKKEFKKASKQLAQGYLKELTADVRHFCEMFDYHNNSEDADWGNSKDAIERTVAYLNGELTDKDRKRIK